MTNIIDCLTALNIHRPRILLTELALASVLTLSVIAETPPVLSNPACQTVFRDVSYLSADRAEKMDVYLPADTTGHALPCFLYIHGGGWFTGDKYKPLFFTQLCVPLLKNGIAVVSINYNMTEQPLWPRNLYDCKTAVRFLKQHAKEYGIDSNLIIVGGTSAGGHLALMTALSSVDPQLVPDPANPIRADVAGGVDFCGITDVRRIMPQHKPKRWGNILFRGSSDAVPDDDSEATFSKVWKTASPIFQIQSNSVPLLLIHGTADPIVEPDHAKQLYNLARKIKADCIFLPVENVGHGIQLCTPEAMNQVTAFIRNIQMNTP